MSEEPEHRYILQYNLYNLYNPTQPPISLQSSQTPKYTIPQNFPNVGISKKKSKIFFCCSLFHLNQEIKICQKNRIGKQIPSLLKMIRSWAEDRAKYVSFYNFLKFRCLLDFLSSVSLFFCDFLGVFSNTVLFFISIQKNIYSYA